VTPGTVDVDLNVEDKLPLHANVELNNRQSPNTTDLRLNGTIHYDNLWQRGHSLSFTYQTAPKRRDDMEAFSASYLTRIPDVEWFSVLTYGVISRSDVALLGDINVVGPGETFGMRGVITLPSKENFYHTLSVGLDYKHFGQTLSLGTDSFDSPITYFPVVASYSASLQVEKSLTQLSATVTHGLRGFGSDSWAEWDAKRYMATPNFFTLNAELTETYELPEGFQLFGRIGGQLGDQPLVSSEQYSIGGMQTVRGYLESTALGDSGGSATLEVRSPNIGALLQTELEKSGEAPKDRKIFNDWRLFAFVDGGFTMIHEPLVEQESRTKLWSYGAGTTFKVLDVLSGMVAVAVPEATDSSVKEGEPRVLFRIWGDL
jgi:hemolysin activation/secretion protein